MTHSGIPSVEVAATSFTPRSVTSFGSWVNGSDATDDSNEVDASDETCVLSVKERARLTTMAKRMTENLLEATDLLGGISWTRVRDKHGISLFQAYEDTSAGSSSKTTTTTSSTSSSSSLPCNVHAVCKFACDIEDVAASLITPTTTSFKRMMATLSSDFLDGAVVQNIVEPSVTNPHRYVGLKWAVFKSSSPFGKDRDLLMLEYVDMIEDAQGQLTAFRVMESVDTPPGLSKYAESAKRTRELVPLMGFMYHSTTRSGELRMTYTCTFNKDGDVPAWIASSAIQSHVEKCIHGISKYTENFRVGREEIVLPQQVVPMSECDHCRTCSKKFCLRRRRYNCLKCGEVCCSSCSAVRCVQVPDIGKRQLRVCTVCVIEARRLSRNAVSGMELPPSPLSKNCSSQLSAGSKVNSRRMARAQSFSTATDEEVSGRRSCDTLLDPVRSRLIEYKTFSSGSEDGSVSVGVPKTSFPVRSFSDGLGMRNKALFAAKRRGSPADLAISIKAFRLYQKRMGNAPRHGGDGLDEHDNTDDESTTSSSSVSPTHSTMRLTSTYDRTSSKSSKSLRTGCSGSHSSQGSSQEARTSDEDKLEMNGASGRAKNIISAANNLAQQARKLSHHRILALQQEHEFMAPMLRNNSDAASSTGPDARPRSRNYSQTSSSDTSSGSGAVLYAR
uniref:FYVE-type domain-containing protein n=1 Tax=Hyaloperonospora arabidopsidis (strain Emoy2) TaxID=559515 RepID=M4BIB6_HYAAE